MSNNSENAKESFMDGYNGVGHWSTASDLPSYQRGQAMRDENNATFDRLLTYGDIHSDKSSPGLSNPTVYDGTLKDVARQEKTNVIEAERVDVGGHNIGSEIITCFKLAAKFTTGAVLSFLLPCAASLVFCVPVESSFAVMPPLSVAAVGLVAASRCLKSKGSGHNIDYDKRIETDCFLCGASVALAGMITQVPLESAFLNALPFVAVLGFGATLYNNVSKLGQDILALESQESSIQTPKSAVQTAIRKGGVSPR